MGAFTFATAILMALSSVNANFSISSRSVDEPGELATQLGKKNRLGLESRSIVFAGTVNGVDQDSIHSSISEHSENFPHLSRQHIVPLGSVLSPTLCKMGKRHKGRLSLSVNDKPTITKRERSFDRHEPEGRKYSSRRLSSFDSARKPPRDTSCKSEVGEQQKLAILPFPISECTRSPRHASRTWIDIIILLLLVFGASRVVLDHLLLFARVSAACSPNIIYIPFTETVTTTVSNDPSTDSTAVGAMSNNSVSTTAVYTTLTTTALHANTVSGFLSSESFAVSSRSSQGPFGFVVTDGTTSWLGGVSPTGSVLFAGVSSVTLLPLPTSAISGSSESSAQESTTSTTVTATSTEIQSPTTYPSANPVGAAVSTKTSSLPTVTVPTYFSTIFRLVTPGSTTTFTSTHYTTVSLLAVSLNPTFTSNVGGWNASSTYRPVAPPSTSTATEIVYLGIDNATTSTSINEVTTTIETLVNQIMTPSDYVTASAASLLAQQSAAAAKPLLKNSSHPATNMPMASTAPGAENPHLASLISTSLPPDFPFSGATNAPGLSYSGSIARFTGGSATSLSQILAIPTGASLIAPEVSSQQTNTAKYTSGSGLTSIQTTQTRRWQSSALFNSTGFSTVIIDSTPLLRATFLPPLMSTALVSQIVDRSSSRTFLTSTASLEPTSPTGTTTAGNVTRPSKETEAIASTLDSSSEATLSSVDSTTPATITISMDGSNNPNNFSSNKPSGQSSSFLATGAAASGSLSKVDVTGTSVSKMSSSSSYASPLTVTGATAVDCGEQSEVVMTFDDLPRYNPSKRQYKNSTNTSSIPDVTQYPPLSLKPYHHLLFSDGYVYAPQKVEPFQPISYRNIAAFVNPLRAGAPSSATQNVKPGEIGNGLKNNRSAFWFDPLSTYLGCDNPGPEACIIEASGYVWDPASGVEMPQDAQNYTFPLCHGQNCQLQEVQFPETFRNLSGLQFRATINQQPRMFFMDNFHMRWSDTSCSAGQQREDATRRGV